MPDLDEGVVHRSAGASIHDSKVHEKFYSSIKIVVIRRAEPSYVITRDCLLLRFRDVLTNELVVHIVGAFGNFGGGETGSLCEQVRLSDHPDMKRRTF